MHALGSRRYRTPLVAGLGFVLACLLSAPIDTQAASDDFEGRVVPILVKNCLGCHNTTEANGGLDLSSAKTAIKGGDSGPVIVSGKPEESYLVERITEGSMPPEDADTKLSGAEIESLVTWIRGGAVWPEDRTLSLYEFTTNKRAGYDWWALKPLAKVTPPDVDDRELLANGIDAFILFRLQAKGLSLAEPADRVSLIRRLYLDMHGLPPTPEQIARFVDDDRPGAYDRLVERVLASPRYGERWARHWLDVVRFAETNGFETNTPRPTAYHYRDYVIAAFNDDKPYDRFVFEQLAGDTAGADAATGFLVGGSWDAVKSPDVNLTLMQRQNELADMVGTTGTAFLGLTVGCARCHDHKFDPVLQKDYYSMQAVFAGVEHGDRPLNTPEYRQRIAQAAEVERQIQQLRDELEPWRADLREPVNARQNVESFEPVPANFVRFSVLATNSLSEPCIDELEVFTAPDDENAARNVALASAGAVATSSGNLEGYDIHKLEHVNDGQYGNGRSWISNTPGTGWVQIELARPALIDRIEWGRDRKEKYSDRLAVEYRIETSLTGDDWHTVAGSHDRAPLAAEENERLYYPLDGLTADEQSRASELLERLVAKTAEHERLSAPPPSVYAGVFKQPGTTHRLYRGDPMQKREPVAPDAISGIDTLGLSLDAAEADRRAALGRWIASAENPLTARVIVNRLWHYHFGTGIVATPGDFGFNGARPSHPELLDWLANELIANDWSLKYLHRLIVSSRTYRQSSRPDRRALAVDAGNRLLWRYPPRRLEAEAIRDSMLHAAGVLDLSMGGPGFSAFEPNENYVRVYVAKEQFGPEDWRRMVYMTKVRMEQDAVFGAFDCPDAGQVCPKRSSSTTAIQALNLLNSQFVVDMADKFAKRLSQENGGQTGDAVTRAFLLAFGREPDADEASAAKELVDEHGLAALCRAIFNANEFLFIP